MGKGSKRRPSVINDELYGLRYDLAMGKITTEQYNEALKEQNNVPGDHSNHKNGDR